MLKDRYIFFTMFCLLYCKEIGSTAKFLPLICCVLGWVGGGVNLLFILLFPVLSQLSKSFSTSVNSLLKSHFVIANCQIMSLIIHEPQCITTKKTGIVNKISLILNYFGSGISPCLAFGPIFGPCLSIFYMCDVHLIFTWTIFVMFYSSWNIQHNSYLSSLTSSLLGLLIHG